MYTRTPLVLLALVLAVTFTVGYSVRPSALAQDGEKSKTQPRGKDAEPAMMCPMMAGVIDLRLHADSPAMLLARTNELGLTEKQVEELKKVQESARKRAREVLTEKQRGEMKGDPPGLLSVPELSRMQAAKAKDKDGKEMMCPMCLKMMQKTKQGKESKEEKGRKEKE
jgi:hypothetical protein